MSSLTADLDRLKSELGEQHYLLQRAPFERLVVEPLSDDPLALSFKILFGYIMVKAANQDISSPSVDSAVEDLGVFTKQQIWIHLYPAVKPGSSVEIQVHSYALDGGYIGKQDRENIGRTASGCAAAFALPGRCKWSRSKLVALAKYYFLRKLVETGSEEDKEKMLLGIPISKTFREDLKAVCRDFEEEVKDMGPPITRAAAEAEQTDSQESELSDLTQGFLEENGSEITASVVVKNDLATPTRGMAEVTRDTVSKIRRHSPVQHTDRYRNLPPEKSRHKNSQNCTRTKRRS
jgi:hypothetical protein